MSFQPLIFNGILVGQTGGGGGGGVSSLNGLTGALTLAAGTGITITPSGSTLTIASTGGGGTPGGTSGQVQYNNAGSFGGFGSWDGTTFGVTGNIAASANLHIFGTTILAGNVVVQGGLSTSGNLGFYGAAEISKPSGDVLTALSNLGLISSPTLSAGDIPSLAYANQSLSNLTNPTSVSQSLIPGSSNSLNLGSGSSSFASNSFSTANNFEDINAGSSTLFGQAFMAQSSGTINSVDVGLYYNPTPATGNLTVTIQTDNSGFPSGTILSTSTFNVSALTLYPGNSPVTPINIPLTATAVTASTKYHVVFDFSGLSGGTQIYFQSTDPSPSGIGAAGAEEHIVTWSHFGSATENFYFNVKSGSGTTWANGYFGTSIQTPSLLLNGSTSGTLTVNPAASTTSYSLTMPTAQGTSGQTLSNNGSGVLSWVTPSSSSGTVTSVSVVSANGFAGTVATSTTTPAITLSTSITGILKGNGTAISAATSGTDYVIPSGSITGTASNITATLNSTLTTLSVLSLPGTQVTGNISGNAANITATSNSTLTTLSSLSLPTTQLTGTLAAGQFPALTGDITTTAGSLVTTLATVNTNTGSFGSSTSIPNFTVNGKGLITAAGSNVVIAPAGTLSGTTLNSTVVTSSLTSLGSQSQALNMNSHLINNVTNPVSAQDAATKNYVDNAIQGLNPAVAVQAATTATSDTSGFTYNNGVSGIGATLTSNSTNTALIVDGFTFTTLGQRLLVKNDTQSPSGAFNGIYYVTQVQALALPIILTRALDYDQPSDINNTGAIPVINGTVNGTTQWVEIALVNTVGTDPLTFTKFSGNPASFLLAANNLSDVSSKSISYNNISPMTTTGDLEYEISTGSAARLGIGSSGQVLTVSGGLPSWQTPSASGGTVTSVALTVPSFLSVSGSPITTSGTLAVSLSGTALPVANGGTGNSSLPVTAGGVLYTDGSIVQNTGVGTTGFVLTSNGASAPSFQISPSSPTGEYYSGFNPNGQFWTVTQTTFTSDFTAGGTISLTQRQASSGFTVTAAAGNLPGITFTPDNSNAIYLVKVSVCASAAVNNWNMLQLTDGTNVITQRDWLPQSTQINAIELNGIYAPGVNTPVTVKVQGASLSGTMTLGNVTGDTITSSLEWTLVRIA